MYNGILMDWRLSRVLEFSSFLVSSVQCMILNTIHVQDSINTHNERTMNKIRTVINKVKHCQRFQSYQKPFI